MNIWRDIWRFSIWCRLKDSTDVFTIWDNRPVYLWNKIDWILYFNNFLQGHKPPRGLQHLEKKIGLSNKAKSKTLNLIRELPQLPLHSIPKNPGEPTPWFK